MRQHFGPKSVAEPASALHEISDLNGTQEKGTDTARMWIKNITIFRQ